MKKILAAILVCFALAASCAWSQQPGNGIYSVRSFGAKGDGAALDTKAIQSAIDRCAATGGVVVFPPGTYLTGSLELKTNVTLHVDKGATILGSRNLSDYVEHVPALKSYNDVFLKHSLFYAERQTNIAIIGQGVIDGQGGRFKVLSNEKPAKYRNRPFVIRFVECTNVTIEDVTLQNSAMWMQQYLACTDLKIRGIRVFNHANKNNDMMDIDGCRNVVITDCFGDTDDDAITLKSTSERATENVVISNCIVSSHCNAIKTGTESTGGFKNITISNMVVKPSAVKETKSGKPEGIGGIVLTNVDGGVMDGVAISNIVIDGPEVPIFIRLGNRARKHREDAPAPGIGVVRNISITNVIAKNAGATGCSITGLPGHPVESVSLRDIRIGYASVPKAVSQAAPEELADQYPEATMFGTLPAFGFFIRHVRDLRLEGVVLKPAQSEMRPDIIKVDVN